MSRVGAAFVIVLFSLAYSVLCFYAKWTYDIYIYIAGISEVLRDYPDLLHEAGQQPARESIAFTPYLLVLSFIAHSVGTSPYHTLQFAGVFNCIMFPLAALYMFKSISPNKEGLVTTALFIVITIFVRGNNYFWSSELSAETLALIQAYPSFLAWCLAMFCFGVCHKLLKTATIARLVMLGALIWVIFLVHNITGSWVILVVCFYASVQAALSLVTQGLSLVFFRGAICLAVTGAALSATLAWPYASVLGNLQIMAAPDSPPFSGRPLESFPLLYLLAVPAYCRCWRCARHFTILLTCGFGVTLAGYEVLRLASDYFERYIFFLAFFPQILVAVVLTDNIDRFICTIRQGWFSNGGFAARGHFIVFFPTVFLAVLILSISTRSYATIQLSGDSRSAFEHRSPQLVRGLSHTDIVAQCPVTGLDLFLFSKTGARFVLPSSSHRGETKMARQADLAVLFHEGAAIHPVTAIIKRYGITKALIGPGCEVNPVFKERLAPDILNDNGWSTYSVIHNPGS
jgi:hypothetical protein